MSITYSFKGRTTDSIGTRLSLLILVLTALLLIYLIPPFYEVPQNDDWAYFLTLKIWFETGKLQHIGWNDPAFVAQALWGRLFAQILGLSFGSLRLSTLLLSVLGCYLIFYHARRYDLNGLTCLVLALLLFFNPLYLTLSYSFNTDVPYTVLILLAVTLFIRHTSIQSSDSYYWLVGLSFALAYLIRQLAIFPLLCTVIYVFAGETAYHFDNKRKIGRSLRLLIPTIASSILLFYWQNNNGYLGITPRINNEIALNNLDSLKDTILFVEEIFFLSWAMLLNISLFLLPLSVLITDFRRLAGSKSFYISLVINISVALYLALRFEYIGWPYIGNYLTSSGTFTMLWAVEPFISRQMSIVAAAISVLSCSLIVCKVIDIAYKDIKSRHLSIAALFLITAISQLMPLMLLESVYDRYILPSLPFIILALTAGVLPGQLVGARLKSFIILVFLTANIVIGFEWLRLYKDRVVDTWDVARQLVTQGYQPRHVAAGFEWDGLHYYLVSVKYLNKRPPFDLDTSFPWEGLLDHRCLIMEVSADSPDSGYRGFMSHDNFSMKSNCAL